MFKYVHFPLTGDLQATCTCMHASAHMHAGPPAWRRGGCQRWRKRWPCGLCLLSFVFLVRWPDRAATSRGPPRLPRALRPCPPASGFHRGPVSSPGRLSERRRMNCLRLGGLTSRGPNPLLHPRELPAPLNKPRGVWPARSTPSVCQERRQHPLAVLGPRTRAALLVRVFAPRPLSARQQSLLALLREEPPGPTIALCSAVSAEPMSPTPLPLPRPPTRSAPPSPTHSLVPQLTIPQQPLNDSGSK